MIGVGKKELVSNIACPQCANHGHGPQLAVSIKVTVTSRCISRANLLWESTIFEDIWSSKRVAFL